MINNFDNLEKITQKILENTFKENEFNILKNKLMKYVFWIFIIMFFSGIICLILFNFFKGETYNIVWITGLSLILLSIFIWLLFAYISFSLKINEAKKKFSDKKNIIFEEIINSYENISINFFDNKILFKINNYLLEVFYKENTTLVKYKEKEINFNYIIFNFNFKWKTIKLNKKNMSFYQSLILFLMINISVEIKQSFIKLEEILNV